MRSLKLVAFGLFLVSSCDSAIPRLDHSREKQTIDSIFEAGTNLPLFNTVEISLRPMPLRDRVYESRLYATDTQVRPLSAATAYPHDDDSVIVVVHKGTRYYNPVSVAQFGVMWANGLRWAVDTGKPNDVRDAYLRLARAHADRLWQERIVEEWAGHALAYYPYHFEFAMHGINSEVVEPIWFSGMAQGYALTLFSWMYELTGEEVFLERATATFHTMYRMDDRGNLRLGKQGNPRTSFVDEQGFVWFDEYPHQMRTQVLNGFIFSIFGLHDYWQITHDPYARDLIAGAAATLRANGDRYRAPGQPSYYCLKHRAQSAGYHQTHINLWRGMYLVTRDYAFEALARVFENDYMSSKYGELSELPLDQRFHDEDLI